MIIETIVWIVFTLLFSMLFFFKDKFFRDNAYFGGIISKLDGLKSKSHNIRSMSLDDQKSYVSIRNNLGEDLPTIVVYTIIFLVIFYVLMLLVIHNFIVGLLLVLASAIIFALVIARWGVEQYREYQFINSLMNFLYAGVLLLYLRMFDNVHPIIFVVGSIILLWASNLLYERVSVWLS